MVDDGTDFWQRDFYNYSTTNSIPLLGFKPGTTNSIQVTVYGQARNSATAPSLLTFVTAPLPANFPLYTVLTNKPDLMEPGYTFFMVRNGSTIAYIVILDNSGNVVWYTQCPNLNDLDVRPLDNGDYFIPGKQNQFYEFNMLGQTVRTWSPATGYPINVHEGFPTENGTILYLSDQSRLVTNIPTSDTISNPPLETANVDDGPAVEISATNGAFLNAWSPLNVIDPTRVTYLTYGIGSGSPFGVDTEHANAIVNDTNDNSIIISMRNEAAVIKMDRATKQLKWILGPPAGWGAAWQPYLLTPVSTPFDWNYGQHAPLITPQGTLLLYNDNNYAASPFDPPVPDQDNYSSAVEYSIDETNMQVSEVWNSAWQTNQDRLFTPYVGKVAWLPTTGNVLVTYGVVTYVNGVHPSSNSTNADMVRIIEYTHDPIPQVVFDLSLFNYTNFSKTYQGNFCYRAYQIPDLYSHLAQPVADLAVTENAQTPHLEFSADPAHNYVVEASTDLVNWTTIGTATPDETPGYFSFDDMDANQFTTRFYRVVTQ